MSKRQEIRQRRQRERARNRVLVIALVVVGALLIVGVLIIPSINNARAGASATQTAQNSTPIPVLTIVPRTINATVDGVHLGDPNAPVKVDVYEDFRCSACLYYTTNYEPAIITDYVETGKVYYTFHSFIVIDGNDGSDASLRSANAAMCAAEQGKFWEYHDTLYTNQTSESASLFTNDRLTTMAQNLGLNMTSFNQCFSAKKYNSDIQNDVAKGMNLSINGTPSIFVNGILTGMDKVAAAIDSALVGK